MQYERIHFIGIGGIGMSALARLCVHEGKVVTGTNDQESPETLDALREQGVHISLDQTVLPEADLYIYSEAWWGINKELLEKAKATGKPTINYFEGLAMAANPYHLIAVAGTHGKTTTTAMLTDVFEEAELDPSVVVGSLRSKTKSNFRAGKSKYFIVEACEYKDDFLALEPDILVVTNLEHDHVDHFATLADVQASFNTIAKKVPSDGFIVVNTSDPNITPVLEGVSATVVDYTQFFDPTRTLKIPGVYNQMNAAAAAAAAAQVGVSGEVANQALAEFVGTWRRFEYKGEVNGCPVYDDYAHHPTAIRSVIGGARELYPDYQVVVAFQSHTYSRTHELYDDFVEALSGSDEAFVLPIYAAREENDSGVSAEKLAEDAGAQFVETFEEAAAQIKAVLTKDSVVLILGAGENFKITPLLTKS